MVTSWYDRTGQLSKQLGSGSLTNVSDLSAEVADATNDRDDPNPIGGAVSSALRFVWNTTMLVGDWYNRNIYQPVIDDTIVFANLALQAPAYKRPDSSLSDYLRDAWNVRDQLSVGQSALGSGILPIGPGGDGVNPVYETDAYREGISPTTVDPLTGAEGQKVNWLTGAMDFGTTMFADPLNYVGAPVKALHSGMTGARIVGDAEKAHTAITRTRGVMSATRVNQLLDKGEMDDVLRRLGSISDPKVSREYINSLKLGADDPDTLAYLSSQIADVEGQKDLFTIALRPQSEEATAASARLKANHGADFEYYVQRTGGNEPLAPEMFATPDDLLLGPKTSEVAQAVVDKADVAMAPALQRAEEFARGLDKMTDAVAPLITNAPTRSGTVERLAYRRAAKRTARVSNDPVVSKYQPHRWHPATWYVEKPSGLVEPDSPNAYKEIDAAIRQIDHLTKGEFVNSGRADEFTDRWFRASTLAEPATERGSLAAGLNDYAVNALIERHHGTLSEDQMKVLADTIRGKADRANRQIREKGWLAVATDSGSIGIVRYPLLQRATPNAVAMYDFQALNRAIRRLDTPGIASRATAAMEGTTAAMDALMGVWKVSVLLRLGYTIRNLTEASMSIAASGNLGNVIADVGPDRLRSWMLASKQGSRRAIDRIGVAGGIWDEPQALWDQREAWAGVQAATDSSASAVLSNLDRKQIKRLAKSSDPERQAMANRLQSIRVELESKAVTYHGNTVGALTAAQKAELGNLAEHADWKPLKSRVLSTSPSATLAARKGVGHQVTSYGDTLDLIGSRPVGFDPKLVNAAKAGDRAAIQRLSDAAFNKGYGRLRLPDSDEWGGVQVVVNQRAIGRAGAKRVVEAKLRKLMDEADEAVEVTAKPGHPTPADRIKMRSLAGKYRSRGNRMPLPIDPDFEDNLMKAMLDGGVEDFAVKLATRRAANDAQIDFLSARLENARRRARKSAPARASGRGFQQGSRDFVSPNGVRYDKLPDVFGGDSGGMWERTISGDTTYSVLSGDSYHSAMASGAMVSKTVQPDNPRYFEAWANILNLHFRDHQSGIIDPVVEKILDGDSFDDLYEWATTTKAGYQWRHAIGVKHTSGGSVPEMATKADLADADSTEKAIASLMSAVDLYLPDSIRPAFRAGDDIDQELLRSAAEGMDLPPLQGLLIPTSAESVREMTQYQRFMNRGVGRAMKVLGSIPESSFARHPLFASAYNQERRTLIGLAEDAQGGAKLTFADLSKIDKQAKNRAKQTVESTLFTLTRRSSVSGNAAIRTLFPFVAAWENVLQRWSKFVVQDPMIPVRFSNYVDKFDRAVTVVDSDGNEVTSKDYPDDAMLVLPGLDSLNLPGQLGETASLLATRTMVPVKSLDVLTQGQPLNPGLGPLGVLPIAELVRRRPEAQQVFQWALPYGLPESNSQIFLPTSANRMMQLWNDSSLVTNTMSKAWLIANYKHEQEGGPEPKFEDVEKMATSMQMMRALLSLTAPFATSLTNERDFYAGKLRDYQAIYGQSDGETRFFMDFPDAGLLVESLSRNPSGARATTQTIDNTKKYRAEVAKAYGDQDPQVAGFIMNYGVPDDATYSQAAYQWQRTNAPVRGSKDTFRQVGNPEDQVYEAHVREGWNQYRQVVDAAAAQLQMQGVAPEDKLYGNVMSKVRSAVADHIYRVQGNTDWHQEYGNPDTSKYERRANSFKALLDGTQFARDHASDTLIQSIRTFLAERDVLVAELQRRDMEGGSSTLNAQANQNLREAYMGDIERLKAESPEFREWFLRFFENDNPKA